MTRHNTTPTDELAAAIESELRAVREGGWIRFASVREDHWHHFVERILAARGNNTDGPARVARVLDSLATKMHATAIRDEALRATVDGWAAGLLGAVTVLIPEKCQACREGVPSEVATCTCPPDAARGNNTAHETVERVHALFPEVDPGDLARRYDDYRDDAGGGGMSRVEAMSHALNDVLAVLSEHSDEAAAQANLRAALSPAPTNEEETPSADECSCGHGEGDHSPRRACRICFGFCLPIHARATASEGETNP